MSRAGRITITDEIRDELKQQKERTGTGERSLLKGKRADMPAGLSANITASWMDGQVRSARKSHLDYVLESWRSLPDSDRGLKRGRSFSEDHHYVPISSEMLEAFHHEKERTGVGAHVLLKQAQDTVPEGLKPRMIVSWLNQEAKTARLELMDYVLDQYRQLPSRKD